MTEGRKSKREVKPGTKKIGREEKTKNEWRKQKGEYQETSDQVMDGWRGRGWWLRRLQGTYKHKSPDPL